jgi:hypothetical protein
LELPPIGFDRRGDAWPESFPRRLTARSECLPDGLPRRALRERVTGEVGFPPTQGLSERRELAERGDGIFHTRQ